MNALQAIKATRGRFFVCEFVKKDGKLRKLLGRIRVSKHVTGEGLAFEPKDYNLHVVWDAQNKGYRMVNLETLQSVQCGDLVWRKN